MTVEPSLTNHSERGAHCHAGIPLSSEDGFAYCVGASGIGAGRAGAALGDCRAGKSACGGRRSGVGGAASAVPAGSWGGRWAEGGSAVMILTGGIEDADGK